MTLRRCLAILVTGCCLLLGFETIKATAPARAASTPSTPTVPGQLTNQFPLGPQRLCCQGQSTSHSQTAAVAPVSGTARAGGGAWHGSSGGMAAVIWIALGTSAAALLAAGVAGVHRARRRPGPVPAPGSRGLPAVAYANAVGRAKATAASSESDELRYRRLDENGDAGGAFNLGVLVHQRGDVPGATAAYGRAEERGDPDAAFNLGVLLYEAGDLDGAEAAWQRSVQRGHARAAANLVFLAHRHRPADHGEVDGAAEGRRPDERAEMVDELVYRRADERGAARGAFNLGVVLHQRGDVTGATVAYQRAEQRGDPDAAFNLGVLLYEAGDLEGAEASWRRSVQRGNARAAQNLEFIVRRRRERETAGVGGDGGDR